MRLSKATLIVDDLVERLGQEREHAGLTIDEMMDRTWIPGRSIQAFYRNISQPRASVMLALLDAMGYEVTIQKKENGHDERGSGKQDRGHSRGGAGRETPDRSESERPGQGDGDEPTGDAERGMGTVHTDEQHASVLSGRAGI